MSKLKLCMVIVLLPLLVLAAYWAAKRLYLGEHALNANSSSSMAPVKVKIGEHSYCIPKSYFRWSNYLQGEIGSGVELSMDIKNLEPWTRHIESLDHGLSEENDYKSLKKLMVSKLDVRVSTLEPRAQFRIWKRILGDKESAQLEGDFYRFESTPQRNLELDYYLIPKDSDDYSWVLACVSGARCRLESRLNDYAVSTLSFDEIFLPDSAAIDSKVKKLINSMSCK